MSKLYKKYTVLKIQDSSKIYIFKSGIFYIFLDEDAKLMSKVLHLKLTNLNTMVLKCGFPISAGDKYFSLLKTLNYNFCIVDYEIASDNISFYQNYNSVKSIIKKLLSIDIDKLSISEAFDLLFDIQNSFKTLYLGGLNYEEKI